MTPDAADLPQLTERQEKILALVVQEFTNRPEPIGSKYLAEHFITTVSSATIRNDMATLEDLGFVAAPHTSAGRVPTEAGYRYFVRRLLNERELPEAEQQRIAEEFTQVSGDMAAWLRLAASSLARTSRSAAVVTAPRAFTSQFKHVEFIATQGRLVLMVMVLHGGDVRQQMLTLANVLPQEILSAASTRLNAIGEGLTGEQIRAKVRSADQELDRELLEIIADTLEEADNKQYPEAYRDGLSNVLPEFMESEGAQQALRLMEESPLLAGLFSEALNYNIGHVEVLIAGEGRWQQVRHISVVLSRYGVTGQASGTMAVFGPTRMRYGRAISAVRYVSGLISSLLVEVYSEDGGAGKLDIPGTRPEG